MQDPRTPAAVGRPFSGPDGAPSPSDVHFQRIAGRDVRAGARIRGTRARDGRQEPCGGGPKNGPADADLSVRVVASAEGERVEEPCGREGLIRRNPPSVPPFSKGGGGLLAGASGWPPELLLDFGEDLLGQERRLRPVAALREPVDGLRRAGLQRVGGEAQALLGAVTGPFFGTARIKTRSAVLTVSESGK